MEMGKNTDVDLKRLCHTCTGEYSSNAKSLLALEDDFGLRLSDMLFSLSNIRVLEDDDFPKYICDKCIDLLKAAYCFQQQIKTAYHYYRERLNKHMLFIDTTTEEHIGNIGTDSIKKEKGQDVNFVKLNDDVEELPPINNTTNYMGTHNKTQEFLELSYNDANSENETIEEPCDYTEAVTIKKEEKKDESPVELAEYIEESSSINNTINYMGTYNETQEVIDLNYNDANSENETIEEPYNYTGAVTIKKEEKRDESPVELEEYIEESPTVNDTMVHMKTYNEEQEILESVKEDVMQGINIEDEPSYSDNRDSNYFPTDADGDFVYFSSNTENQSGSSEKAKSRETDLGGFRCRNCALEFDTLEALRAHSSIHACRVRLRRLMQHDVPKRRNPKKYPRDYSSRQRKRTPSEKGGPFKCIVCGETYSLRGMLLRHKRTHRGNGPVKCDVCGKTYLSVFTLQFHKQTHGKKHKCDICGRTYSRDYDLRKHRRTHDEKVDFECDVCGKTYLSVYSLRQHKLTHSENNPKCDICGRTYLRTYDLRRHEETHGETHPWKCDICGKTYSTVYSLQKHKWMHSENNPSKCNVCGKTYLSVHSFQEHKRTHTENYAKCDVCGKMYSRSYDLQQHKRTHGKDNPFKCTVCGRAYLTINGLRKHNRTHSEQVSFKRNFSHLSAKGIVLNAPLCNAAQEKQ